MTYVFLVFLSIQANAETLQLRVRSSHSSSDLNSTKLTSFQKKPSSYYYLQMN